MGFAHAWTYDHVAWRDLVGQTWFSAMPTLAAAAVVTEHIRLGTLLASPNFRHPVPFIKEALTVDDLAGGRFILGVGAGAGGVDAQVLGEPPWTRGERTDRFVEFVELIHGLLSRPVSDFHGRYYRARQAYSDPAAGHRPRMPLAIGATGRRGMRLAARLGDIWVTNGTSPAPGLVPPSASPEVVGAQVARVQEMCRECGRNPATLRTLFVNVDRAAPPLASVDGFREQVARYREAGITDMVVPFPRAEPPFVADRRMLERVATEVLPGLAGC